MFVKSIIVMVLKTGNVSKTLGMPRGDSLVIPHKSYLTTRCIQRSVCEPMFPCIRRWTDCTRRSGRRTLAAVKSRWAPPRRASGPPTAPRPPATVCGCVTCWATSATSRSGGSARPCTGAPPQRCRWLPASISAVLGGRRAGVLSMSAAELRSALLMIGRLNLSCSYVILCVA